MHKLMLLFSSPRDRSAFETRWSEEFVRSAEKMPGLRRVSVSRTVETLLGPAAPYLIHEFYFDDLAAARSAMASPEGQAAGRALMGFASGSVGLLLAEHLEEDRA